MATIGDDGEDNIRWTFGRMGLESKPSWSLSRCIDADSNEGYYILITGKNNNSFLGRQH
jgi:hypothetical protein